MTLAINYLPVIGYGRGWQRFMAGVLQAHQSTGIISQCETPCTTAQIAMKPSMQKARAALDQLPRCGAHSRRSGQPCRNPVMANGKGRCRMHGGTSTGRPPTHGKTTQAYLLQRDWVRLLLAVISYHSGLKVRELRPTLMTAKRAEEVLNAKLKGRKKKAG
jgi:hypothetical protein